MKIIGKISDYYDSAQAFGAEPFVFKRETITEPKCLSFIFKNFQKNRDALGRVVEPHISRNTETEDGIVLSFGCIGFCGTIYPFILLEQKTNMYNRSSITQYCYSIKDVEKFIEMSNSDRLKKEYENKTRISKWDMSHSARKENFEIWFEYHKPLELKSLFIDLQVPYFMTIHLSSYQLNDYENNQKRTVCFKSESKTEYIPVLKNYGFQKVVDPYTAFQEISMFISGVIGTGENETVQISDVHMRDSKGFDEWSFKKLPSKNK